MLIKIILSLLIPQLSLNALGPGLIKGAAVLRDQGWHKINQLSLEPIITAPSAVVLDAQSGQILFKKNHTETRPIASITKLITAYLYLKNTNYDLTRQITLLGSDEILGGQRYIYRGEIGTAQDLLNIALIGSDNSAALALARDGSFLTNFIVETENKVIQTLNLKNSYFSEPSGLSLENISTALEIAYLSQLVFKETPIANIINQKIYIFSPLNSNQQRVIHSTNDLLETALFQVTAGKTGYTKEAGYCLTMKAAKQNGKEIIIVILGAETSEKRFQDAKTLAWWIFKNFE